MSRALQPLFTCSRACARPPCLASRPTPFTSRWTFLLACRSSRWWACPTPACAKAGIASDRRSATAGIEFPPHRITVNLSPADVRKAGASFDLPIALGILAANGVVERRLVDDLGTCLGNSRSTAPSNPRAACFPSPLRPAATGSRACCCRAPTPRKRGWSAASRCTRWSRCRTRSPCSTTRTPCRRMRVTASVCDRAGRRAGFLGRARPGDGQARAGGRGRRRPQHPDDRPARLGQDDAGQAAAEHPAAARRSTSRSRPPRIHSAPGALPAGTPLLAARPFRSPHHTI